LGLITRPNKYGHYPPGALQTARNIWIRDTGIIEQAESITRIRTVWWSTAPTAQILLDADDAAIILSKASGVWGYSWDSGSAYPSPTSLTNNYGDAQSIDTTGRWGSVVVRGRLIVTCDSGTLVFDAPNPSAPRQAGLVPPRYVLVTPNYSAGNTYPSTNHTCITVLLRRKFSDGYELVSAPTQAVEGKNGGLLQYYCYFRSGEAQAGDLLEVYRTRSQDFSTNVGADYYLATTYTLTSTDVTNGYAFVTDSCPDEGLGEALYTNPGQQGAASAALPPPTAKCVAQFQGHTFYANLTYAPSLGIRVPVYWGENLGAGGNVSDFARTHSIGTRVVTLSTTSGSPTATGISSAEILGLAKGQFWGGPTAGGTNPFATDTDYITAVGASSITMSANATATGTFTVYLTDMIEIDGTKITVARPEDIGYTLGSKDITIQQLDRVLPTDISAAFSNPGTTPADQLVISRWFLAAGRATTLTIRASNPLNYDPVLPDYDATVRSVTTESAPHMFAWSELNQPENVPALNFAPAGAVEIHAMVATRDALWFFCADGLRRLSGTGGTAGDGYDWRLDMVDSTLQIAGPQAACAFRDRVFAYTTRGFVAIDSSGAVLEIGEQRIGNRWAGAQFSAPDFSGSSRIVMVADEPNDEVLLRCESSLDGTSYTASVLVYNVSTDTFVEWAAPITYDFKSFLHSKIYGGVAAVAASGTFGNGVFVRGTDYWEPYAFQYHPVYGENPFTAKHWQDCEVVAYKPTIAVNSTWGTDVIFNTSARVSIATYQFGADVGYMRGVLDVPRDAPAIANSIAVGLDENAYGFSVNKIVGMSVRYVDLTDQRLKR